MDETRAKALVKKVLNNRFDKSAFAELAYEIVKDPIKDTFTYFGNTIFHAFSDKIAKMERICKYEYPPNNPKKRLDVLVVYLKKGTSLERARTMQRNFVARYLNGSRGGEYKDAALVAFVSPDENDWRLSFVKMTYKMKNKKPVEEFTSARRYSFSVGANENTHTAQSKVLSLLLGDQQPTLEGIGQAFSVEPVTREFFTEYKRLYQELDALLQDIYKRDKKVNAHFTEKGIDPTRFAKKLLGQIVFLYFLQKKGWFGVDINDEWGTGPKNFLRVLFDKEHLVKGKPISYTNFHQEVLEPLFYEALRYEREQNDYYEHFDCRIPFLNGGLFEPLNGYERKQAHVSLPDSMFSNADGTGILDVFDLYNFTVKEDEPLEKEVAIDPEMLGKVFERLLGEKERGDDGIFYTPRPIVHYMCQQALIGHLAAEFSQIGEGVWGEVERLIRRGDAAIEHEKYIAQEGGESDRYKHLLPENVRENAAHIDEALAKIHICDPAAGSGAFLVGMMNEIVRARMALTPYIADKSEEDYDRKPYTFKRNAIQHSLYGVDKNMSAVDIAKLRLWLSLVVDEERRDDIKPLPNLDAKVVAADSLLELDDISPKNGMHDMFDVELQKLYTELQETRDRYFDATSTTDKNNLRDKDESLRKKILQVISAVPGITEKMKNAAKKAASWDPYNPVSAAEWFDPKSMFGIPDFHVVIGNPPYVKKEHLDAKTIKDLEDHYKWSDDLYVHFIFRGIKLTRENGYFSYIANDSFVGLSSKKRARELLLEYSLQTLVKCPPETFQATIYTAIFAAQKAKGGNDGGVYQAGSFSYPEFNYTPLGSVSIDVVQNLPDTRFIFPSPVQSIYEKIYSHKAAKACLHIIDGGIDSGNVRPKLFFKEKKRNELDRLLQGRQITHWGIFWNRPEAKFKYCDANYQPLPQKGTGRGGKPSKHNEYWTFRADKENHHQKERLLMRQTGDGLVVAYHSEGEMGHFYTDNTLYTILPACEGISLKYAMAIFNSKLMNAVYQFLSQEKGKTLAQIKTNLVKELPFAIGEPKPIVKIVDKILAITASPDYLQSESKQEQVRQHEREIDRLVYQLYGLNAKDIAVIEGAAGG